jgi:hypothetical protein
MRWLVQSRVRDLVEKYDADAGKMLVPFHKPPKEPEFQLGWPAA